MYLLLTPPLITNVTPLRVPLGASLRPNLRPPGKFPLMLTIGGKNNMSPAHRDKVFCRIRQSWKIMLFSQQNSRKHYMMDCNHAFVCIEICNYLSSDKQECGARLFLHLGDADTTDKYLTFSRYTRRYIKHILDIRCKHRIQTHDTK